MNLDEYYLYKPQPRDRTWVSCIAGGFFTLGFIYIDFIKARFTSFALLTHLFSTGLCEGYYGRVFTLIKELGIRHF